MDILAFTHTVIWTATVVAASSPIKAILTEIDWVLIAMDLTRTDTRLQVETSRGETETEIVVNTATNAANLANASKLSSAKADGIKMDMTGGDSIRRMD